MPESLFRATPEPIKGGRSNGRGEALAWGDKEVWRANDSYASASKIELFVYLHVTCDPVGKTGDMEWIANPRGGKNAHNVLDI